MRKNGKEENILKEVPEKGYDDSTSISCNESDLSKIVSSFKRDCE